MLAFFVIIPVLIAVWLFLMSSRKLGRIIAIGFQLALTIFALYLFIETRDDTLYTAVGNYYGLLGIILRADNLAAVFVLLSSVIFLMISIYNLNEDNDKLYWFLLFLLESALIGLFLSRDFFNTFVLIEVGTVVVTILLMYDRKRRNMFQGMMFLMINIVVMQFYLFGIGYLYMQTGTLDMYYAGAIVSQLPLSDTIIPYALIMTAIASKASLMPMVGWLPKVNAMPGSRSSIAAVMSALQVKSYIYIFIRFQAVFAIEVSSDFFLIIGIITGVAGVILALAQTNIRLILAYSTVAQIGLIMIGLNMGYYYGFWGSIYHIVNHSLFKAALFLITGMIIIRYKTQDITKIRGLFKVYPIIAWATAIAILGIIGAPLFNGSVSKYFMMRGTYDYNWLEWTMMLINLGTVLIFIKFGAMLFGKPKEKVAVVPIDWCKQTVVLIFGALCFFMGVFGENFIYYLFNLPVNVDAMGYIEKSIIFLITFAIGFLIYWFGLKDKQFLPFLKNLSLGFKTLVVSVGAFFALILVAIYNM